MICAHELQSVAYSQFIICAHGLQSELTAYNTSTRVTICILLTVYNLRSLFTIRAHRLLYMHTSYNL